MKRVVIHLAGLSALVALTACTNATPKSSTGERPMDEVPVQKALANGDREYGFRNGCVVVLEPRRAVVKTEGAACQSHHRDIALLYASGD